MSLSSQITPEPEQPASDEAPKEQTVEEAVASAENTVSVSTPVTQETATPPVVSVPSPTTTNTTPSPSSTPSVAPTAYEQITDALLSFMGDPGVKQNMKVMLYGDPGSTKTSQLAQIPNQLVWDLEGGMIAAVTAHHHTGVKMAPNIKAMDYGSMQRGEEVVNRLADHHPAFDWIECFSVDSFSALEKHVLRDLMKAAKEQRPASVDINNPDTVEGVYTVRNEILSRFCSRLRDLDRDIVIICHAQTVERKGKNAKTYPDFSEKLANRLEGMMDIVGYMEMREFNIDGTNVTKPVMVTKSPREVHCKSRIPLPPEIVDPSFPQLKAVWQKAIQEGTITNE